VAAKGKYIAFVSTTVETSDPHSELLPGLRLLGPVLEQFVIVSNLNEPLSDGTKDKCFISKVRAPTPVRAVCEHDEARTKRQSFLPPQPSFQYNPAPPTLQGYDATSHFESTVDDALDIYTRITGEVLDVSGPIEGVQRQS